MCLGIVTYILDMTGEIKMSLREVPKKIPRIDRESKMEVNMRFSENIIWRRDEFFGYINRRVSICPQNGFIRAGVSSILKFCVQNFYLLCPGAGDCQ